MVEGQPLMPSAVFAAADGTLFVGQEAERQAAIDPARYEPNPKRRIDEGELLLGNTVLRSSTWSAPCSPGRSARHAGSR